MIGKVPDSYTLRIAAKTNSPDDEVVVIVKNGRGDQVIRVEGKPYTEAMQVATDAIATDIWGSGFV